VLGWIAKKLPHLVREIQNRGHEVASHGNNHLLSNQISNNNLKAELRDSKKLLEDIIGTSISGFRAPSFSISNSVIEHISDAGYFYDSSYNSFNAHERYGQLSLSVSPNSGIAHKILENFYELPISNLEFGNTISYRLSAMSSGRNEKKRFVLPWGGGAYFRMLPFSIFKMGVNSILKKDNAYLFYAHPWEIDYEQPRVEEASYQLKFRHYKNIKKTFLKLSRLVNEFEHCKFITCSQYLASEHLSIQLS
jgi:peptidoglycan-N-acetylglucosamine deacetylase